MDKKINPEYLNLQLFAEGAGDGGTGAEGQTGASSETAAVSQTKGEKKNSLSDVIYGKQTEDNAQAADVQQAEKAETDSSEAPATVDRNAEFEKLIKGEYKDLFDAKMQDTIQKRLSKVKESEDKLKTLSPMLEMLSKKYGVDVNDSKALIKAIEDDDAYYEEEAMEKGVSVEHLKAIRKIERENSELKKTMQEQATKERAARQYSAWMQQAEELKKIVPSFDLETELKNPQFVDLLRSNIDVGAAYKVLHLDEMMSAAMQHAAQTAERKVVNNIAANGRRPNENGMSSQSAANVKSDVSQLSKADRAEVIRRVMRGEKISFS